MQFKQNPYVVNSHDYLQRQGYGLKYEKAGIYCIKVDEFIVYIGKSHDMLWRVA